jgi:hypothetical protein
MLLNGSDSNFYTTLAKRHAPKSGEHFDTKQSSEFSKGRSQ